MKREILRTFLGMIGMTSLMLTCAEAETILGQLSWSGSMMLICFLSMKGFERLMADEEKEERV